MAKTLERDKARAMRTRGTSITGIATTLNVSKSTVSYWCRDIILSKTQLDRLVLSSKHAGQAALLRIAEGKRNARLQATRSSSQEGEQDVGHLNRRDLFMIGLALYWGEGYKSGNEECGFTNSNPNIIQIYIDWLTTIYNVKRSELTLRVSINNVHQNREKSVRTFWSRTTGVPLSQFTTTSFIRSQSKKQYQNTKIHFGTLRVKVKRGSALRRRILGSLQYIATQYS